MIYFLKKFLLILILLGLTQEGENVVYFIRPTGSDHYPASEQPCLNLSEFASNHGNDRNITLSMLPGNHSLVINISLSNFQTLEMCPHDFNAIIVTCELSSHFTFESAELVSIRRMTFIGCGDNLVRNVNQVILQETTLQGRNGTGTSLTLINSTAEIDHSSFIGNQFGTVQESVESLKLITTNIAWLIVRNVTGVVRVGGALISTHSNISISHSSFENNTAEIGGDIYAEVDSKIVIFNSTFIGDGPQPTSEETPFGGAIFSHRNFLSVTNCRFHKKHATVGASIMSSSSNVTINGSDFDSNTATDHSGGVFAYNSTVFIHGSTFHNNTAVGGAGVATQQGNIVIAGSVFTSNTAYRHGAAVDLFRDTSTVRGCHFEGNVAHSFAGAVLFWLSTSKLYGKVSEDDTLQSCDEKCSGDQYQGAVDFSEFSSGSRSQFISNSAPTGAALHVIKSSVESCGPIFFSKNNATLNSNVYFLNSNGKFQGFIGLSQNLGSFFAFNSNISFSGCAKFVNGSLPENTTANFKEAGALTLYQTMLSLQGEARFECNHAETGGAILAIESELFLSNQVYVINNSASISGGGLYLSQSELFSLQESALTIIGNSAAKNGGGINIVSSSIKCIVTGSQDIDQNGKIVEQYMGAILNFAENTAQKGGAIYLEANSKVTVLKDYIFETDMKRSALNFVENSAQYGGAIYVNDATNSGSCEGNPFDFNSPKSECFISIVSTQTIVTANTNFSLNNVYFDLNTATISGPILFGGLLDRCIVSPFNEVDRTIDQTTNKLLTYKGDGLQYLMDISTVSENETQSISSYPVQICPCVNGRQNCGYFNVYSYVEVMKGFLFNVSLTAVDQVYRPVNATIQGYLHSSQSNLLTGQVTQIPDRCTDVTFQIISPHQSEQLTLFASDGPCKDAELSTQKFGVTFLPCSCPIGFTPSNTSNGVLCLCTCHSQLSPYVTECNTTTQSFRRTVNV